MVSVIRSISCLSLVLCCRKGLWPFSSLYSMQPSENQSALESYAVPLLNTSGAMYPWVPLECYNTISIKALQDCCLMGVSGSKEDN